MDVKTHPSFTAIYTSHQTKLAELSTFGGQVSNELYAIAVRNNLLVAGPIYWVYTGMDGNPESVFTLEITLPVTGEIHASGDYNTKQVPAFKCFSAIHLGPWDDLKSTYQRAMEQVAKDGLQKNGIFREIYLNMDYQNQENNITEVQVGLESE